MTIQRIKQIFEYLAWPLVFGLLAALLYLQLAKPGYNERVVTRDPAESSQANVPPMAAINSYANAVQRAIPSVVNIYTRTRIITRPPVIADPRLHELFLFREKERMESSLGSGVIIDSKGYLLTNHHVVDGADEIIVLLNDGRESHAEMVGTDSEMDLAVLKIDIDNLTAISFADIDSAQVGDVVLAIGNPYGIGQTVTQGIISATSRDGLSMATNYIQTDAAINPGNSGGALIDTDGRLLGINTSILNKTGASIGIGFAIPVDTALKVLDDITRHGKSVRGVLGIVTKPVPPAISQFFRIKAGYGLLVTAIYTNGPAHKSGLLPGDIILELDGMAIESNENGAEQISKSLPGKQVSIVFMRQGRILKKMITPVARTY